MFIKRLWLASSSCPVAEGPVLLMEGQSVCSEFHLLLFTVALGLALCFLGGECCRSIFEVQKPLFSKLSEIPLWDPEIHFENKTFCFESARFR